MLEIVQTLLENWGITALFQGFVHLCTTQLSTFISSPSTLLQLLYVAAVQLLYVAAALGGGWLASRYFAPKLHQKPPFFHVKRYFKTDMWLWLSILCLALGYSVALAMGETASILRICLSLLSVWTVIKLTRTYINGHGLFVFISTILGVMATLGILGIWDETLFLLASITFEMKGTYISILDIVRGIFIIAALLWGATAAANILENRITKAPHLTPSNKVLFSKLLKISLIGGAALIALDTAGIDLTVFAIFTGALGVGLGFGLQKIVSNFVSGIILLLEKSVKPGDVIVVEGSYGWIKNISARYVSVITRDGIEHIIPNEDFITQKVENWSFTNNFVRLKMPLGVAYDSDLDLAMKLCMEAGEEESRVLQVKPPLCLITGFGDSRVDLELRIWIDDPEEGCFNIKSKVYKRIWDKFKEHNIKIPFPQRDIHIKEQ